MRIAIVLNTSWNIYNFRIPLIRALQQQGHEIHTIAPTDPYTPFLVREGCIHHSIRMDSRGANPIRDFALIVELLALYRRLKPDVILHFTIKPNIYGTLAAAVLRIPVINNVCGLGTVFLKKGFTSHVALLLYRLSFRFAQKIFFQNPDDLALFEKYKVLRKGVADLVPGSGIDLNYFTPAPRKRSGPFTFLLISRLITDKGIVEYVEAIEKLRKAGVQARFQLLGAMDPKHKRGIPEKIIRKWIEEGSVEYLGTTNDVRSFIRQADCIVLPSYREGTPRTLLEAASMGRPVVATDVPGCRQVVEHDKNGLLCRPRDADDLARKMYDMLQMPEETLARFSQYGRKKIEAEFDQTRVISKYLQALAAIAH